MMDSGWNDNNEQEEPNKPEQTDDCNYGAPSDPNDIEPEPIEQVNQQYFFSQIEEEADIIATGVKEDARFYTLDEIATNEATLERET